MKRHYFENRCGKFTIYEFDNGRFSVSGNINAAKKEFKKIHRMPPNEYGNFAGREQAGFTACRELINSLQEM